MGALHNGHLDLCRRAKQVGDEVILSVFVNPTQFGPTEDFDAYPRTLQRDCELAESVGVDVVFAPDVHEVYPRKSTVVACTGVTARWEGAIRPGHFNGVTTVVCKLFNIVQPTVAVFGWKDIQQCVVIRQMVEDLNLPVELEFVPTTRERDGLALSSRNAYLSSEHRIVAPELFKSLQRISDDCIASVQGPTESTDRERSRLSKLGFNVDYLSVVDGVTLDPIDRWLPNSIAMLAAKIGSTRLIDNIRL